MDSENLCSVAAISADYVDKRLESLFLQYYDDPQHNHNHQCEYMRNWLVGLQRSVQRYIVTEYSNLHTKLKSNPIKQFHSAAENFNLLDKEANRDSNQAITQEGQHSEQNVEEVNTHNNTALHSTKNRIHVGEVYQAQLPEVLTAQQRNQAHRTYLSYNPADPTITIDVSAYNNGRKHSEPLNLDFIASLPYLREEFSEDFYNKTWDLRETMSKFQFEKNFKQTRTGPIQLKGKAGQNHATTSNTNNAGSDNEPKRLSNNLSPVRAKEVVSLSEFFDKLPQPERADLFDGAMKPFLARYEAEGKSKSATSDGRSGAAARSHSSHASSKGPVEKRYKSAKKNSKATNSFKKLKAKVKNFNNDNKKRMSRVEGRD
jgi:ElaB/YqjD/DUF883 family membrane-anchored ribosome-binding protein